MSFPATDIKCDFICQLYFTLINGSSRLIADVNIVTDFLSRYKANPKILMLFTNYEIHSAQWVKSMQTVGYNGARTVLIYLKSTDHSGFELWFREKKVHGI